MLLTAISRTLGADGVMAVAAWFRKSGGAENPDDVPTGQIAAISIAQIVEEADGVNGPDSLDSAVGVNGTAQPESARPDSAAPGTEPVTTASESDVQPVTVPASAGPPDLEQALADRQALIQLCFYAMDRARSGGVVERLEHGLAEIGVRALRPDGDRFDPAVHEAGSAVQTEDAALDGVVAETEVIGFADGERLLRAPIVTVYTKRAP